MTRRKRFLIFALAGLVTGLVIAALSVRVVTQSRWGRSWVRAQALGWLANNVRGSVRIDSITGAGLLGGLTVHGFEIIDSINRPFVRADSATVTYRWRTLLRRDIELRTVRLWRPRLVIEQLPGDSLWNFQHVFPPAGDTTGPRRGRLIRFLDADVFDGFVVIRQPLEHNRGSPVDTARMILERVPGGLAKVMRFENVNADFDTIIWEAPNERGRLFTVRDLSGRGFVWRDPVNVRDLRGYVTTRDTIVSINLDEVAFGSTRATVEGQVIRTEGMNRFDILIDTKGAEFKDLGWLYPRLPESGTASGTLRIQTQRPKGTLWYASNARIVAPGTRMSGSFGVVIGDTLYFTDVDLRAAPLNVELLESMLPGRLPVQGLLIGTVEVKGPLS